MPCRPSACGAAPGQSGDREPRVAPIVTASRIQPSTSSSTRDESLPPQHWLEHIDYVTDTNDAIPGSVHLAVIDAGEAWIHGPHADVAAGKPTPSRPPTPDWSERLWLYEPVLSPTPERAEDRWRPLADSIHPAIAAGDDWPALATEIDRAAARGEDVTRLLPQLAAAAPLPDRRPATELQ